MIYLPDRNLNLSARNSTSSEYASTLLTSSSPPPPLPQPQLPPHANDVPRPFHSSASSTTTYNTSYSIHPYASNDDNMKKDSGSYSFTTSYNSFNSQNASSVNSQSPLTMNAGGAGGLGSSPEGDEEHFRSSASSSSSSFAVRNRTKSTSSHHMSVGPGPFKQDIV